MITKANSANRFLFIALSIMFAIVVVLFLFFEHRHEKVVLTNLKNTLQHNLNVKNSLINNRLAANAAGVRFLAGTPPIQGIVRATNTNHYDQEQGTSLALWKDRLAQIFNAYLTSQPDIAQIRYIGLANNGKELVRVQHQHGSGQINIVEEDRLQSKASRDYFIATTKLQPGQVYISDINLNREFGRLDFPFWPTYRVATPVYDKNNALFGMIIINYQADKLIEALKADLPPHVSLFMLDTNNNYVIHPEESKAFEFELGAANTWQDDYSAATDLDGAALLQSNYGTQALIASSSSIPLGHSDKQYRKLQLIMAKDKSELNQRIAERRQTSTAALLLMLLIGSTIIYIYRKILLKQIDLSYAQSQYAALVESSGDAIIALDEHGKIKSFNKATQQILGLQQSSTIGVRLDQQISQDDSSTKLSDMLEQCLQGTVIQPFEIEYAPASKPLQSLSISLSPIKNDDDKVVAASAIIRDITEQVAIKKEIEDLNASLEQQVEVRTRELELAKNEALSASSMKSSFVANVSHEIRTPLNGIIGMHNLLRHEPLNEKQSSYLEMATQSAKSLLILINDILDLSKIEAGKLDIEEMPINLIDNISQVVNSMGTRAMEKNVEVILDIADIKHPIAMGDALRIRQILTNLLSNAIKFTDQGEIRVKASTDLDNAQEQVSLHVSVTDTGIGIEKNKLNHLFKAFSQEDASTTRRYGGTGLGLSIVYNLCQLMGGSCSVESEKGNGTTFRFTLALKPCPEPGRQLSEVIDLQGQTIHICDTSDYVREALRKLLLGWGAEVTEQNTFYNNESGETDADIIISQLGRSGENDQSVQEQLQTLQIKNGLPEQFVFTLTVKQRHSVDNLLQPLSHQVVYKPVLPLQLASALATVTSQTVKPLNMTQTTASSPAVATELYQLNHHRILVVDDNEINQQVAAGILEHFGFKVSLAGNGEIALKLLQEQPDISLILMDCQMPVMDGFKATQLIREGYISNKQIPIIAMTAGAMTGDREQCLNAGMNDYLAKPISADDLEHKVSLWLKAGQRNQAPPHPADNQPQKEDDAPSHHDLFWDKEATLKRLLSDEDLFCRMLEMFQDNTPELMELLGNAIVNQEFDKIRQSAHKLKGSSAAIGALTVLDCSRQLEKVATQNNTEQVQKYFDLLQQSVTEMLTAITKYKQNQSA